MLILSILTIHHLQIKKRSLLVKMQIPATLPITTPHLGYASAGPNIYGFSLTKVPSWFLRTPGLKSSNLVYQMEFVHWTKIIITPTVFCKKFLYFQRRLSFGLASTYAWFRALFSSSSSFSSYVAFNFQYHDRNFLKKRKMEFKHFSIVSSVGSLLLGIPKGHEVIQKEYLVLILLLLLELY